MAIENRNFFGERSAMGTEIEGMTHNWGLYLAAGLALIAIGVVAVAVAVFSTLASMAFLGSALLIAGIVQGVHAFSSSKEKGFFPTLLVGILYAISGVLILRNPGMTAVMLTFLIAPLFIVAGLFRTIFSLTTQFPQWGWACFSGIVTFAVGIMLWAQWPSSGLWFIGTLVGVEIMMSGISTAAFGMMLRSLQTKRPTEHKIAA